MAITHFNAASSLKLIEPFVEFPKPKESLNNTFTSSINRAPSSFENYFSRIHKKYPKMDTTNIEKVVDRILNEKNDFFLNYVREKTKAKDTFFNRFFEVKTPLGTVLKELQNSQESPNRKLLSKSLFDTAKIEAKNLLKDDRFRLTEKSKYVEAKSNTQICHPRFMSLIDDIQPIAGYAYSKDYIYAIGFTQDNITYFYSINIANPSAPVLLNSIKLSSEDVAVDIGVLNDYAYVTMSKSQRSNLISIDIKDPINPKIISHYYSPLVDGRVTISNKNIYIVGEKGLVILDIKNPAKPIFVSFLKIPNKYGLGAIKILDPLAFIIIGNNTDYILIINIKDASSPDIMSAYPVLGGGGNDEIAINEDLFIADGSLGIQVVNIKNPAKPTFISSFYIPGGGSIIAKANDFIAIADLNNTFYIVDVTNISNLSLAGSIKLDNYIAGIIIQNNLAYILTRTTLYDTAQYQIQIIELNCPQKTSKTKTALIIGISASAGAITLLSAGVYYILKKRKKSDEKKSLLVSS